MCLFVLMMLMGPRAAIIIWWLSAPGRWGDAFDTIFFPIVGWFLFPLTTLTFVAVAPLGNVGGWDWLWLALAFIGDLGMYSGGAYSNRERLPVHSGRGY